MDYQSFYLVKNKFPDIKSEIKRQIGDDKLFADFIKPILLYSLEINTVRFIVPNNFIKTTINNNYADLIKNILNNSLHSSFDVEFLTSDEVAEIEDKKEKSIDRVAIFNESNINNSFSIENFIVSNFNKSAFNGACTVLKERNFNPIFIFGGVGLGKTHLLNAVGREYIKIHPQHKVLYVNSSDFLREVLAALSSSNSNAVENLKDKYQSYNLLLFDDIQFLSNKEKTSEIFFNIFNYNVAHNNLIIMTSDTRVDLLERFASRMKSRFSSGLNIEIKKPSLESILQILEEKIKDSNTSYIFPKESLQYIAHRKQNDIRELQGILNNILFFATNNLPEGSIISVQTIKEATFEDSYSNIKEYGFDINPDVVINEVALNYGLTAQNIKSKSRKQNITHARHVCVYVLRKRFDMKYEQIGKYFGNRSHTTIMDSYNKIEHEIKNNDSLRIFIDKILKSL